MPTTDAAPANFFVRRWKLILNIVTVIALLVLVYAIRDQLVETIANLKYVNLWILLLIIPIEALNYHSQVKLYQQLFAIVGNKLSYKFLFKASLELNFVNHVFPSGGVSGISYFGLRLKNGQDITASKATLVQVMKVALVVLTFEVLLVLGLIILAAAGKASNLTMFVTGSLSTMLVLGTMAFSYIIGSKRRINRFFGAFTNIVNRLIQIVRPRHPETINVERARDAFDDLHENYLLFRTHYNELRWPAFWALMTSVTELAALYVVYIAFGEYVNVGAVILAYAVANFAGLVSVLPGGVGIYEALMTAVLSAGGVPAATSLPVTVMYRVINTLIQVPPGYYFYHKALHEKAPG
ncbi:MAG TPA: lysylphosphatidylglycerol synthase transmembrane domain-containing protein [Candidatus Saccharimonadales bacterium]|jgi:hypothetical protein